MNATNVKATLLILITGGTLLVNVVRYNSTNDRLDKLREIKREIAEQNREIVDHCLPNCFKTYEEKPRNNYGHPVAAISAVPFAPVVEGAWVDKGKIWKDWSETVLLNHLGKSVAIESVRTKSIPFYSTANRNVVLAEALPTGSSGAYYIIGVTGKDAHVVLDGKGTPIHKMNDLLGISIDSAKKAESYLKFFVSAISISNGIFVILDLSPDDLSQQTLKEFGLKPVFVYAEKEIGWWIDAGMIYGNNIYDSSFLVQQDGKVEIVSDSLKGKLSFNYWVVMDESRRLYKKAITQNSKTEKKQGDSD
ncbi:hypothetical protein PN36_14455 [Candidatus Thiomargarita nelsonii]|uniref:Uncharacterized protein n=1 Tax=Candidatus Thiomargarita nelsonii TaxID=1003181 RepID=A0A0A6PM70_9GAMM|nr:hypothetical protein PN36_14455 [Candidatus Thiomargarita nelsonii]